MGCGVLANYKPQTPEKTRNATLAGVLYGLSGGTGGGVVRMQVGGKIVKLAYQKPFPFDFGATDCVVPGAIWEVKVTRNTKIRGGRYPQIIVAKCAGEFDEAVRSAVMLVEEYLQLVAERRYREAYRLMSASWRRVHAFQSLTRSLAGIDFSGFLQYRPNCVEVADFEGHKAVLYAASCFVRPVKGAFTRRFSLVWNPELSRWEIVDTRQDSEGYFQLW